MSSESPKPFVPAPGTSFFDNETLSDVTVYFSGYSLHAHKVILSRMSSYFKAAFTNGLEETYGQEITLKEDDPIAVHSMIRHIYGLSCRESQNGTANDLLLELAVFTVADKYDVPTLRSEVKDAFDVLVRKHVRTDEFVQTVQSVWADDYGCGDFSMKETIMDHCFRNLEGLIKVPLFKGWLLNLSPFSLRLAELEVNYRMSKIVRCPNCSTFMPLLCFDNYDGRCVHCGRYGQDWKRLTMGTMKF